MTSRAEENISRRLHVLHVLASGAGEVATVTLGYVRDQVERGWGVSVACSSRGFLGYDARQAGARTLWWQADREPSRRLAGEALRLSRIVRDTDPDVVHLHGFKAGLVGRLVLRDRLPSVFQPHAWSYLTPTGGVRAAALRWERFATRWAGLIICVSEAERATGSRLGIDGRTVVIPHGVSLSTFRPQGDRDRASARRLLGLPEAPTVVSIGDLVPQNGQRDLLLAWPDVLDRVPDARLLMLGEGRDRRDLLRLAVDLPGVTLVGARSDVRSWLAAADVVAVRSRWDGMSLLPLEAMACARSVVATSVSGIVESVPDDAGAIVGADDRSAMAAALSTRLLAPDLAHAEGLAGRAHVQARHDVVGSAHELARAYLRLVSERRSG